MTAASARRRAIRTAGFVVAVLAVDLLNIGFHVAVARGAGVANYGAIGALIPIATVAAFLAVGTEFTVARMAILHRGAPTHLVGRALPAVWPGLLASSLLFALAGPISAYLHLSTFVPVLLGDAVFCAVMVNAVATGILVGRGFFPLVVGLQFLTAIARLGGGAGLARGPDPITGAMVASAIPVLAVGGVSFLLATRARHRLAAPRLSKADRLKSVTGEGVSRAFLAACLWAVWSLPLAFVRHDLGPAQAGSFAAAQLLTGGLIFATAMVAQFVYPSVQRRPAPRPVLLGFAATAGIAASAGTVLVVVGPDLLPRLFGAGFGVGSDVFFALSLSAAATAIAIFGLWMVRALRRYVFASYLGITAAVPAEILIGSMWHGDAVAIALGPVGALTFGVVGMLVASSVMARRIPRPLNVVLEALGRQLDELDVTTDGGARPCPALEESS